MTFTVVPARDAGWPAVEAVMLADATSRDCWCQFHVLTNTEWAATTRESRHALLDQQVGSLDPPRGLVALEDDEPVGWVGVEPRERVRHALASRLVAKSSPYPADAPGVWAVYCILVPPRRRRGGIGRRLLHAAIEHAWAGGASAIEGYPMDTATRGTKALSGFSTGTVSMFESEAFRTVAALPSGRTLMVRAAE